MIPEPEHLPIALRAYAVAPKSRKPASGIGASDWTLTFDCETRTDASQSLRFGAFQLRKGEAVKFAGLFYDPDELVSVEVETLKSYAKRHKLMALTRVEFVNDWLFMRAYELRARIVGFNLPFDISRLAIDHGIARGAMYGGFTFTMSRQKIWPHVRVKHLSRRASIIDFAAPYRQRDNRGQRNRGDRTPVRRGYFLDVSTLAYALLSRGFTLGALSKFLNVPNPKLDFDDFDGPISDEILRYAMRDVQTTWECYAALMAKLEALELPDLQPEQIYSEASLGKAYLRAMGIAPWREVQPDFPEDLMGTLMSSYYGGRSEVRIRRKARQVILCDFLSMYPTVCTLMGLWRFVTASGMTRRDATAEVRNLLASVTLEDLQLPEFWQRLPVLVKVIPDTDIFPVRAAYQGEQLATIATNYLTCHSPLWFTLADCVAAKLLTGKAPNVVEAIGFDPGPLQPDLRPVNISGNPKYRVDPVETDFFKRVIELRKEIQGRMKGASGALKATLESEQLALKICANSTSYGIWLQMNVAKLSKRFTATVIGHDGGAFERETNKAEKPGEFFHPLLGSLITGAARLMLAITECLIERQGLEWAFCDTDSMAIAKPADIAGDEFRERVQEIANWFAALNPYEFPGSILKIESENDGLATGEPEALYCWAVSSKRYALFNLPSDGRPILRKVSAHGLGHLLPPYEADNPPAGIPAPDASVMRDGVQRWHCDLWFEIVSAGLGSQPDMPRLDFHPAMNAPAVSRYAATAPELLNWFKAHNADRPYRDQVKPFGFLLSLSAKRTLESHKTITPRPRKGRPRKVSPAKPVAPFAKESAAIATTAFDRISGRPVPSGELQSYRGALAQYHLHPESKFLNGDYVDRGTTQRRHIRASAIHYIGKEANEIDRQQVLGVDSELDPEYGLSGDSVAQISAALTELVALVGKTGAAKALRIPTGRLSAILLDRAALDGTTADVLTTRLPVELVKARSTAIAGEAELQRLLQAVRELGLRKAAQAIGCDPSNLRRRLT
jgi:hypothetical protein